MQSQENGIQETAPRVGKSALRKLTIKKESNVRAKRDLLPFISLLYILNGNHNPRSVQRLNVGLAILFFAGGVFSGWDLLPVVLLFAAVAVVNGANLWYLKKRGDFSLHPAPKDILTQIELRSKKTFPRRMTN
jgi:hypothetical protein